MIMVTHVSEIHLILEYNSFHCTGKFFSRNLTCIKSMKYHFFTKNKIKPFTKSQKPKQIVTLDLLTMHTRIVSLKADCWKCNRFQSRYRVFYVDFLWLDVWERFCRFYVLPLCAEKLFRNLCSSAAVSCVWCCFDKNKFSFLFIYHLSFDKIIINFHFISSVTCIDYKDKMTQHRFDLAKVHESFRSSIEIDENDVHMDTYLLGFTELNKFVEFSFFVFSHHKQYCKLYYFQKDFSSWWEPFSVSSAVMSNQKSKSLKSFEPKTTMRNLSHSERC